MGNLTTCVELQGGNEPANRSRYSASTKRCWALAVSNIRSRQRRSMPSLVICTPSTGCSSSSSSEYSFDLLNIIPSDRRHRETRKVKWSVTKHLQFLLNIRVVPGALLRSGPATSKRSAAASSRLVLTQRENDRVPPRPRATIINCIGDPPSLYLQRVCSENSP